MSTKRQWIIKTGGILAVCGGLFIVVWPMVMGHYYKNVELRLWRDRYTKAAERLDKAATDHERFYPLTELAKSAFYLGFTNDAGAYARRLLTIAPQFLEDWNYGNAIHDGNKVLGQIALQEGRREDAKRFLIAAGKSPGSPQLDSFGPDMGLAQDLLERGERETVLEYLALCGRFWKSSPLEQWSEAIKAGKTPDLQNKYP